MGEAVEGAVDPALTAFTAVLASLTAHATHPEPVTSAGGRIDRIAVLERIKAAVVAAQHAEMVAFGREQVEEHLALVGAGGLDPAAVGRGVADQIALACRVSPFHGSRRLGVARALAVDLPLTAGLLAEGLISEQVAETVVSETRHLDGEQRRLADKQMVAGGLAGLSPRKAAAWAKKCAYTLDPAGYVARGRTARADRRVGLRPAPDTMSVLTGFLPVEQGVACLAALRAHTDTVIAAGGDDRNRDQIMADTLVARLTGQATATDVNVEVGIVIPVDALVGPAPAGAPEGSVPATARVGRGGDGGAPEGGAVDGGVPEGGAVGGGVPEGGAVGGGAPDGRAVDAVPGTSSSGGSAEVLGYGPIPAAIADDILATTTGRRWWRRLFTAPGGGPLVGCDPKRRRFDGVLAHLIAVRDHGRCRDPYCDAPIRHVDHIRAYRAGGPTSLANGRGVCARGNHVREMPGWRVDVLDDGLGDRPHTVRTTTPTGHTYVSTAGPAP